MLGSAANLAENRPKRSEEHTSELQSRFDIVCRLLLEKKNSSSQNLQPAFGFLFSILCLILAFSAAFFGFARYRLEQAKNNSGSFTESELYKIPFEANYDAILSIFLFAKGQFQELVELICNDRDFIESYLIGLIQHLLEKIRYYFAEQIYK